jgi:hypothetical protein
MLTDPALALSAVIQVPSQLAPHPSASPRLRRTPSRARTAPAIRPATAIHRPRVPRRVAPSSCRESAVTGSMLASRR